MLWDCIAELKERLKTSIPFLQIYLSCNGELDATLRSTKFRRYPLPRCSLEIPINLYVRTADEKIYTKVKEFVSENCMELQKTPRNTNTEEIKEDEDDFFGGD